MIEEKCKLSLVAIAVYDGKTKVDYLQNYDAIRHPIHVSGLILYAYWCETWQTCRKSQESRSNNKMDLENWL